jgi:hypothetical protein
MTTYLSLVYAWGGKEERWGGKEEDGRGKREGERGGRRETDREKERSPLLLFVKSPIPS